MWPEWHSGCLWIRLERGGGLIFTTGLGNTGLQSLGEKMVLITDLPSLSPSVSLFLLFSFCLFSFLSVFPASSQKAEAFLRQLLCSLFWVQTQNCFKKSSVMLYTLSQRNGLTERSNEGFCAAFSSRLPMKHLQRHTRPMIMLCLSDNGCFHKCQFEIMMYCS